MAKFITWLQSNLKIFLKVFLFLATIAIIVALFPKDYKFRYDFNLNRPWLYNDLIAPFDFTIKKSTEELEKEQEDVVKSTNAYFIEDKKGIAFHKEKMNADFTSLWKEKHKTTAFSKLFKKDDLNFCNTIFDSIYRRGIIDLDDELENKSPDAIVLLIRNNMANERVIASFFTLTSATQYITAEADATESIDREICKKVLVNSLTKNILYDKDRTQRETMARLDDISLTRGMVQKGERIISRGEIIGPEKYQVLLSLKDEYEGQKGAGSSFLIILAGQAVLITIAVIVLFLFLAMFRKDILADNKKLTLILSLIILMVVATSVLIMRFDVDLVCLVPLCLVPFIVRAFFDTRLGLFVHIITIVIVGFLVPNGFEFIFLQLTAGIVTIISIVNLEKRSQFFLTSVYIFITYAAIYTGMNLAQDGNFEGIKGYNFLLFAGSSALTLLSFPLIYLYERVFGYVTNLTLLEISSINNKLLRELSLKAPGTFQHALQVANLAEEAVYRIEGNSILARTGALYHDIGKLENPQYFIENQAGGINPHDELSYIESAGIIMNHITDGLALARKNGLPDAIVDFIRTHHGTGKARYFLRLFEQQQKELTKEEVATFTYRGPLPFSKETAVVMMADAVEAASKSIKVPDKQSISDMVEEIIDFQIEERQFKNSDLTLKDINRIKHVFKQRLMSIYHIRIEYPKEL